MEPTSGTSELTDRIRVVGIDPSLTATGVVVLDREGICKQRGVIKVKKTDDPLYRNYTIIDSILLMTTPRPEDYFLLEGYAYGKQYQVAAIAEFVGQLKWVLWDTVESDHIFSIAPTTLKKFATGKGNAQKSGVVKSVYKKWHFDAEDDNEADAFVAAQLLWHYVFKVEPEHKYEIEVINKFCQKVNNS